MKGLHRSNNPLSFFCCCRPPPVEAVFGGTEDARGAKGERTAAAVLTSIYTDDDGSLSPTAYFTLPSPSNNLPSTLFHTLNLSHYFSLFLSFTKYLFIYAVCSAASAARSLLFARHLMDIFVSLSLRINNIVTT